MWGIRIGEFARALFFPEKYVGTRADWKIYGYNKIKPIHVSDSRFFSFPGSLFIIKGSDGNARAWPGHFLHMHDPARRVWHARGALRWRQWDDSYLAYSRKSYFQFTRGNLCVLLLRDGLALRTQRLRHCSACPLIHGFTRRTKSVPGASSQGFVQRLPTTLFSFIIFAFLLSHLKKNETFANRRCRNVHLYIIFGLWKRYGFQSNFPWKE